MAWVLVQIVNEISTFLRQSSLVSLGANESKRNSIFEIQVVNMIKFITLGAIVKQSDFLS